MNDYIHRMEQSFSSSLSKLLKKSKMFCIGYCLEPISYRYIPTSSYFSIPPGRKFFDRKMKINKYRLKINSILAMLRI